MKFSADDLEIRARGVVVEWNEPSSTPPLTAHRPAVWDERPAAWEVIAEIIRFIAMDLVRPACAFVLRVAARAFIAGGEETIKQLGPGGKDAD